ncbi:molybdenum cofactor guanylyltransferase [Fictibacillus sp. b24]|uniref:molybdenum cofactor guanylyltransferase n=1 Tax=Fictibacillus sp. b24 TaxID=3055863 RepID=UPI0025A0A538|nr:molybdenum cofactor guanylyltransferase [Fictibacillus sp. b24]MDM5315906.1 molybdenum cofactor guanylyltransferase [Fictibacillus sp. b24]
MDKPMSCVGVVIAGGKSRRFGSPKVFAEWNNKTFFEHSMNSIAPLSDNLIAVVREEWIQALQPYNINYNAEIITDIDSFKGNGPLAGIYSAMMQIKADYYLVSPCDMPRMSSSMYEKWLKIAMDHPEYDCVVPLWEGKVYPLNGVYKRTCFPDIETCLRNQTYKVLSLLKRKNTHYIEISEDEECFFHNVNTKEELLNLTD